MGKSDHGPIEAKMLISAAAALSIVAGYIHVVVMPTHFKEWWGYGTFFLTVAIAQVLYGGVLLVRSQHSLLVAGIVGNLALIALWLWTRMIGIPLVGPGAGEREAVESIDLVSKAVEVALVVLLAALVRSHGNASASRSPNEPSHDTLRSNGQRAS